MTYRVNVRMEAWQPRLPEARATGWFCAACPHTEVHVVMQQGGVPVPRVKTPTS